MLARNTCKKVENKNWTTFVLMSLKSQVKIIKDKNIR